MKLLVLTGATVPFNDLVLLFNDDLVSQLHTIGITEISIQYGLASRAFEKCAQQVNGFAFKDDLLPELKSADLIVSHAGTGSILDALRLGKPLIVVVNNALMNNHQLDVASQLANKQLLISEPSNIYQTIKQALTFTFQALPAPVSLAPVIRNELNLANK